MCPVPTEFDTYTHEELSELYKTDPERFNALAAEALRQACNGGTDEQKRMCQQLQWTIDARLKKAKSPLERLQIMEGIFYDRVFGEKGVLWQLKTNCSNLIRFLGGSGDNDTRKRLLNLVKK